MGKMVLIDDMILSNNESRVRFLSRLSGKLFLTRYEMAAMERYFPGIGISWRFSVVAVAPQPFKLTITDEKGPNVMAELYGCQFVPEEDPLCDASEMIPMYFMAEIVEIVPVYRESECA